MATRFRLTAAAGPPAEVSPATQSYTHGASYTRNALLLRDSTTIEYVSFIPDAADDLIAGDTLGKQYVSGRLAVQDLAAQTVSGTIRCTEGTLTNNLFLQLWIGLYTADGTSLIAELLPKSADNTEMPAGSLTLFGAGSTRTFSFTTTGYTMVAADLGARIVVEISATGTPTTGSGVNGHNFAIYVGASAASDHAASDGSASNLNPWIEFANSIYFLNVMEPKAPGRIW